MAREEVTKNKELTTAENFDDLFFSFLLAGKRSHVLDIGQNFLFSLHTINFFWVGEERGRQEFLKEDLGPLCPPQNKIFKLMTSVRGDIN